MKMKAITSAAILSLLAGAALADDATLTGHVDLTSKYILRGISSTYGPSKPGTGNANADAPESEHPVLQWGADWTHPDGFYAGYWASQINYSYRQLGKSYADRSITDFQHDKSVENDFYGGYNGKLGEVGYTLGLTGYYYLNGTNSNAFETKLGISYGPFSAAAQTLLKDVIWGNKGDTYWTLNYTQPLPADITFTASLGYYTYKKEGRYLGSTDTFAGLACGAGTSFLVNGCFAGGTPKSSGFRHLVIGFTQPIGNSGFTWGLQGLIGGDNRFGVSQDSRVSGTLSYGF
ncbi:hypothetical protein GTP44_03595 [Duganella sp. FT50W]|uniref:Uncharacterized protein n=1 Tax=Duganella lactea TaxID=2692173 RepID=A0A6L8MEZ6_9BURK|nr:TorF family putative porin [Duganella lactea]MYM81044.1 hypothetical protein [Duganella lactea]